ncbi:hypothetical protein ACJIZ3_013220 [Penstemon smallii]|uniref:Uncharacterized protein n=1 Tax=Penstemon smallii TaxID=265156 RepID=A0ABD3USI4_9LAMI
MRSKTRRGGLSWANGKISGYNRLSKVMDRLQCSNENDEPLKVSLTLVSLHEEKIPSLKRPYLSCSSTSSVGHLCQYVAMQTSMEASEIEILLINKNHPINSSFKMEPDVLNPCHTELQLLDEHLTLGEIHANFIQQNLVNYLRHYYNFYLCVQVLAYRQKAQGPLTVQENSPNI